jgi:hypothetical protein
LSEIAPAAPGCPGFADGTDELSAGDGTLGATGLDGVGTTLGLELEGTGAGVDALAAGVEDGGVDATGALGSTSTVELGLTDEEIPPGAASALQATTRRLVQTG